MINHGRSEKERTVLIYTNHVITLQLCGEYLPLLDRKVHNAEGVSFAVGTPTHTPPSS